VSAESAIQSLHSQLGVRIVEHRCTAVHVVMRNGVVEATPSPVQRMHMLVRRSASLELLHKHPSSRELFWWDIRLVCDEAEEGRKESRLVLIYERVALADQPWKHRNQLCEDLHDQVSQSCISRMFFARLSPSLRPIANVSFFSRFFLPRSCLAGQPF
jgi:hypothetical protein